MRMHKPKRYRLTRKQKILVKECGLNPKNYQGIDETSTELVIRHKYSGEVEILKKKG